MSLTNSPLQAAEVNVLAPAEQATHWLAVAAGEIALTILAGVVVARLARTRRLHWSWSAGALVLALLARPLLQSTTAIVGLSALIATWLGRRWHREDLDAGGDLTRRAAQRFSPLQVARIVANGLALRRRRARAAAGWCREEELIVGRDRRNALVSIPFGGSRGGTHTLLVGATGSGKTVTQTWMTVRASESGMAAIVIDPKGDPAMRAAVGDAARVAGRPLLEWTPGGPCVYNPYARGSESEIADKVLAGEPFS